MTLVLSPAEIVQKREAEGRLGLLVKHETWKRRSLGELCSIQNGAPFESSLFNNVGTGMPLIRIRDISKSSSETYYSGPFDDAYVVTSGDMLIGMDGDFRLAKWMGDDGLLNQRVCRLVVISDEASETFVELIVPGYLDAIWEETSATTVKHLSSRSIGEIPIPIPPVDEQEKIVEILEEELSRLDAALSSVRSVREKSQLFRRSLLHAAFTGSLTGHDITDGGIPVGWKRCVLGDLARWGSGGTPKSGTESFYGGPIKWAVIGDLTESWVSETAQTITELGLEKSSAKLIAPGTVMLAMYGASIGRTGIAAVELATNQAIAYALPKEGVLDAQYLLKYLQSQKENFVRAGQGGAQPNISQALIKAWPILLPPIEEQAKIVEVLDEQLSRLDASLAIADVIEKKASAFRCSLLQAAFSGNLTKEWREGAHV